MLEGMLSSNMVWQEGRLGSWGVQGSLLGLMWRLVLPLEGCELRPRLLGLLAVVRHREGAEGRGQGRRGGGGRPPRRAHVVLSVHVGHEVFILKIFCITQDLYYTE